jgi:hypothetical protein
MEIEASWVVVKAYTAFLWDQKGNPSDALRTSDLKRYPRGAR